MSYQDEWWDLLQARLTKLRKDIKIKEDTDQYVLVLKSAACKVFRENDKRSYTIQHTNDDNVESTMFSEILVNQLMQYAFDMGAQDRDRVSYDMGWDACINDVVKKLGLDDD